MIDKKISVVGLLIIIVALLLYFALRKPKVIDRSAEIRDSLRVEYEEKLQYIIEIGRNKQDSLEKIILIKDIEIDELVDDIRKQEKDLETIRGSYSSITDDSLRVLMINEFRKAKQDEKNN